MTQSEHESGETNSNPIAALVIGVPIGLMLWGMVYFVLVNLIR